MRPSPHLGYQKYCCFLHSLQAQGGVQGVGQGGEGRTAALDMYGATKALSAPLSLSFILKPEVVIVFLSTMLSHQRCCVCQITHRR